nr:RNA-directed DNA polymerase, eukaryota, reverse transcriptase zinc-binding domain protein [Tanacetum cinerariifolium]
MGRSYLTTDMEEFVDCVSNLEVIDLSSSGFFFTWSKNPNNPIPGIMKKLDKIMVNENFLNKFSDAHAIFLPYLTFDHSCGMVFSMLMSSWLRTKRMMEMMYLVIAMEAKLNDVIVDVLKLVDDYSGIDAYDVWNGLRLMLYVHDAKMNDQNTRDLAHLKKKRIRLQLYTKSLEKMRTMAGAPSQSYVTTSWRTKDGIRILTTALVANRLKDALEDSMRR